MQSETAAEYANDLYSWLESSGGDYNDILAELRQNPPRVSLEPHEREQYQHLIDYIQSADAALEEAFEILDSHIVTESTIAYDGNGHAEFHQEVLDSSAVESVALKTTEAVDNLQNALARLDEINSSIPVSFGAHKTARSALQYLHGESTHISQLADEMQTRL